MGLKSEIRNLGLSWGGISELRWGTGGRIPFGRGKMGKRRKFEGELITGNVKRAHRKLKYFEYTVLSIGVEFRRRATTPQGSEEILDMNEDGNKGREEAV